jgi:hypothetical protein
MDEKEIIPLIYTFLKGMETYRKVYKEMEKYFNSKGKESIDPELEDLIKTYRKFRKFLSIAENFL